MAAVQYERSRDGARGAILQRSDDAWAGKIPLDEQAIGGQAGVERAGAKAVQIGEVSAGDRSQAHQIEVGIARLQRIEGPLDDAHPLSESGVALRELEAEADTAVLVSGQNADAMRVHPIAARHIEGQRHADQGVAVKGAQHVAGKAAGDHQAGAFVDLGVRTPDGAL